MVGTETRAYVLGNWDPLLYQGPASWSHTDPGKVSSMEHEARRKGAGVEKGGEETPQGSRESNKNMAPFLFGTKRQTWGLSFNGRCEGTHAHTHTAEHTQDRKHVYTHIHTYTQMHTETWVGRVYASGKVLMSERLVWVWCYQTGNKAVHLFKSQPTKTPSYRGPCLASYLASMFLHLPSSFLKSATSWRRAEFSFSRNEARIAIWFSFSRRASRERLAAILFFLRLAQYLSSCSLVTEGKRNKILGFSRDIRFQPHVLGVSQVLGHQPGLLNSCLLPSQLTRLREWSASHGFLPRERTNLSQQACVPRKAEIRAQLRAGGSPHTLNSVPIFFTLSIESLF